MGSERSESSSDTKVRRKLGHDGVLYRLPYEACTAVAVHISGQTLPVILTIVRTISDRRGGGIVGVNPSTIDTYRSRVMAKLEINDVSSL
jgi:hypothetical protein